jgi:hypothetical protein
LRGQYAATTWPSSQHAGWLLSRAHQICSSPLAERQCRAPSVLRSPLPQRQATRAGVRLKDRTGGTKRHLQSIGHDSDFSAAPRKRAAPEIFAARVIPAPPAPTPGLFERRANFGEADRSQTSGQRGGNPRRSTQRRPANKTINLRNIISSISRAAAKAGQHPRYSERKRSRPRRPLPPVCWSVARDRGQEDGRGSVCWHGGRHHAPFGDRQQGLDRTSPKPI